MTALQKIIKGAKSLQKKNKNLSWKDAVKKSSKLYNAAKKPAVKKAVKKKAVTKKPTQYKSKTTGRWKNLTDDDRTNITQLKKYKYKLRGVGNAVKITDKDFSRIDNDVNGNPRYVIHWTAIANTYAAAVKIANKIGGRKFHTKKYGGGIVFSSFNIDATAKRLNEEIAENNSVGKKIAAVKKPGIKKSSSHKDTKSHNVNIKVVSGLKNMAAVAIIKERLSIIADHEKKILQAQNNIKWFGKNKALRVQLKKDIAFSRSIIKNSRQAIAIAKKMI